MGTVTRARMIASGTAITALEWIMGVGAVRRGQCA
jgi:hypothetical protein